MCWTWRGCALPPHTLLLSASCAPITIKQAGNPGVLRENRRWVGHTSAALIQWFPAGADGDTLLELMATAQRHLVSGRVELI
jgi:hypothetical protein